MILKMCSMHLIEKQSEQQMTDMSVGHTSDDCFVFCVCCVDDDVSKSNVPMFVCLFETLFLCSWTPLACSVTNLVVARFWEEDLSLGVLLLGNQEVGENHQTPGDERKTHVDWQNELCC